MGFGDMRDLRSVDDSYGGPKPFASAETGFRLNVPRAALVITDPQVDFLSPSGAAWGAVGRSAATAAAMLPGGDGYHAALINFHYWPMRSGARTRW
jgi:hypothetical protein